MANPKDFTARQIRTSQLIASGGIDGTSVGLIVYSASISSDMRGGFAKDPGLLADVGEDVYFFVSGSKNSMVHAGSAWTANGEQGTTVFGGDLFVSGNFEWAGASNTSGWTEAATWLHPTTVTKGVGIGSSADPVSMVKVRLDANVDTSGTELREDANYHLILRNDSNTADRWAGIGFEVDDTANENTTATILARRVGSQGLGNLEFYTKINAGSNQVPVKMLALHHDSTVNITGSMLDIGWDPNSTVTPDTAPTLRLTTHHTSIDAGDDIGVIEFFGKDSGTGQNGIGAKIVAEASDGWNVADDYPTEIQFWTNENGTDPIAQRMVIKDDGAVGIGIESPAKPLHLEKIDSQASIQLTIQDATIGSGITLGGIYFGGSTDAGVTYDLDSAQIIVESVGAWDTTNTDSGSKLSFWTTPEGSATVARRMSIADDGRVGIGKLTGAGSPKAELEVNLDSNSSTTILITAAPNLSGSLAFRKMANGPTAAALVLNGDESLTLFNSGSAREILVKGHLDSGGLESSGDKNFIRMRSRPLTPLATWGSQMLFMSGVGESAPGSDDPATSSDANFWVSGSIGSKGSQARGTAVFAGDMLVSGTIYGTIAGGTAAGGWVDDGDIVRQVTSTDRVGIGTQFPSSKVEIFPDDIDANPEVTLILSTNANNYSASLAFRKGSNGTAAAVVLEDDDSFTLINSGSNKDMFFRATPGGTVETWMHYRTEDKALSITGSFVDIGWDPNDISEADGATLRLSSHDFFIGNTTTLGTIEFYGHDTTGPRQSVGAKIEAQASNTWSAANAPTELRFYTTEDIVPEQRMVIDKEGKVGIGITSLGSEILNVVGDVVLNGTNVDVAQNIRLMGDLDTLIEFTTDKLIFEAGGDNLLQLNGGEGIGINNDSLDRSTTIFTADRLAFGTARMGPMLDGVNQSVVLILSGGGSPTELHSDPQKMTDVGFYVSGSIGSKGSSVRGTALFAGDLQVSGTIYGTIGSPVVAAGGWVDDGTVVRLETITDKVGIGTVDPGPDASLAVDGGDVVFSGSNLDVAESIRHIGDTDTLIEFDTNKITFDAAGDTLLKITGGEGVAVNSDQLDRGMSIHTADRLAFGTTRLTPTLDGSNQSVVLILSGGAVTSPDPTKMTDVGFYVSGSAGSRGTSVRGTSLFDGDVVISGTLFGGSPLDVGSDLAVSGSNLDVANLIRHMGDTDTSIEFTDNRIALNIAGNTAINMSDSDGSLFIGGGSYNTLIQSETSFGVIVSNSTDQVFILSGSGGPTSPDESDASDLAFFVSGTIGSKGTAIKGTSVFGGDLQVSGTIYGTIAGGTSAGGWTDDGSVVKLTTISDQVGIGLPGSGDTAPGAGVKLAVRGGDTVLSGTNLDVANRIRHMGDTDTLIEFTTDRISLEAGGVTGFSFNQAESSISLNNDSADMYTTIQTQDRHAWVSGRFPFGSPTQSAVLILSGGGPTSTDEANYSDLAFFVSGSIGSRGTSDRGTSVFGGDVVVSGSHQVVGSLSLGEYGPTKEITSRTTKRISYSDIVSSAQTIDSFIAKPPNSSGFRCVKYTIGGKPTGSNDRFFSELIVVGDQGSNNGAVATSETRVHTDIDSGGSLEFLNETHVDITATRAAGVVTIKIKGDSTYFQGNGNSNELDISFERLVILD